MPTQPSTLSVSDITNIAIALVSIAALGLSIYNLVVSRRDHRPSIKVKSRFGFIQFGGQLDEPMILINIANIGRTDVYIQSIPSLQIMGVLKSKGGLISIGIGGQKQPPLKLLPGDATDFWLPIERIKQSLNKNGFTGKVALKALVRDSTDQHFWGNRFYLTVVASDTE